MTPIESFLFQNGLELLILVGGGVFAFVKLNSFTNEVTNKVKENRCRIEEHLVSDFGHAACRLTADRLVGISDRLRGIENKLDVLDNRTIEILRNGRKRDEHLGMK